jgi:hypothetical protein
MDMGMSAATSLDPSEERQQWVQAVRSFCDDVTAWSTSQDWHVVREELSLTEESLGSYTVPTLTIQTRHGTVVVEPVGRLVMGATGRIDLFAYPTLFRVMLLRSPRDGGWRIRTDSGIFLRQAWGEGTFLDLVADLTGASDESSAH